MKTAQKKIAIILITLLVVISLLFVLYNRVTPQRHIELGAWTTGFFDPVTQTLHPEKLQQFEQLIDKKVSIAHFYRGWEALSEPSLLTQFNTLHTYGWTPMINVNPYFFAQCDAGNMTLYKAIANGNCDTFLHKAGKNLAQAKEPFYLLFAWEMNNPQLEWSVSHSGSSSAEYVAAWRHIHTIFKQEHVTKVLWVFCPNTLGGTSISYDDLYPGNEYVDWTGLDGYNWGTTQSWSHWQSFSEVFSPSYNHLLSIAPHKPMLLAEVNTTDQGGDKSAWYTDMLTKQLPENFPNIKAVVIYNEDRTAQEHVNWDVNITSATLQAFISGVHTGFY
ncbi:MAG TPA: glycosyl hydrolase [Candidatus Saccharimonadales bacterium]|nr:glycosyl hydrolase [Candidatus Saccharimonadales bacterium]